MTSTVIGPDQSFSKAVGFYAGAKRVKMGGKTSQIDGKTTNMKTSMNGSNSIVESYKNVDFFAIKEPYHVVKNKFALGPSNSP